MEEPTGEITPDAVFGTLANETRVRIVDALGDTGATAPEELEYVPFDRRDVGGRSYSALREAAGVDDKGRFNYHLGKLLGTFVRKDDGRYRLTWLGQLTRRYLVVGLFGPGPSTRRIALETTCPRCDHRVEALYSEDQVCYVDCPACDCRLTMVHVPRRGASERSATPLLDAASHRFRSHVSMLTHGVCPWCAGSVDAALHPDDGGFVAAYRDQPVVTFLCADCGGVYFPTVGETLLTHPAVVGFYQRHGADLRTRYPWSLPFATDGSSVTLRDRETLDVEVTLACESDRTTLELEAPVPAAVDD